MTEHSKGYPEPNYQDAIDGDIYLNPYFGDMWIVDSGSFIKINDGYAINLDNPEGFIKVGHVDGVFNKKRETQVDDGHFSEREQQLYKDMLDKNSVDTGINIFDLFGD